MPRRASFLAAALLAAAALALTACTGGGAAPSGSSSAAADPNATVNVRLVLEPGNLDIRQTAGAALDQILIDNVYQGLVSRTPEQKIVPALASEDPKRFYPEMGTLYLRRIGELSAAGVTARL